ncbi:hypothetical protein HKX48_009125 [Thoreauomyces humboldtii]|nr:hypothetical protein HKX48_009125 [Thoreauomyces humboldtii]
MAVPLTSWLMSSEPPPEIDTYDILLDRDEVVLDEDQAQENPFQRIEGVVRLHLTDPLVNVKAITFRFVAGAVAKYDDDELMANLRGPERLVDRTINLWDRTDPTCSAILGPEYHEFRFALRLPSSMPPSLKYERGHVQYILVAGIEWEPSTVCGVSLPFWTRSPVTVKKEVTVRRIPGKIDAVFRRLTEAEEKKVKVVVVANDEAGSWSGKTIWSPSSDDPDMIKVTIPTSHPTTDHAVPVKVHLADGTTLTRLRWTLRQHASFVYNYNVSTVGAVDSPSNLVAKKTRDERFILRNTFVHRPEDPAAEVHHVSVSLLNDDPLPEAELVQDVETSVMTIHHSVTLQIGYRVANALEDEESEIELPIVLYVPPTVEVVDRTPGAVTSGVDCVPVYEEEEEEEGGEEPPVYVAGGEGVRRRKA